MAQSAFCARNIFQQTLDVTVSGQCKCGHVIDHKCPNGKMVIKSSQRGGTVNILVGGTAYECQFCGTIPHNHRCK